MANVDASIALQQRIDMLKQLPTLTRTAAPRVAKAVEDEMRKQIAQGTGPDGKPWPITQAGHKALRNATNAVTVRAVGGAIVIRVNGIEARHHLGAVRGGVRRPIIPTGKIPDPVIRAIGNVVDAEFKRTMGMGR